MRTILIFICLVAFSACIYAQNDFKELDRKSRDFYEKGDFLNLKKTSDQMFAAGMDYYYLRIRLGISAFKKGYYKIAFENFSRALKFSSMDTISKEYIYYSYLLSGRKGDADIYLLSVPFDVKNSSLKSVETPILTNVFTGTNVMGYDYFNYSKNKLYYEAVKSCYSFSAGAEAKFFNRFKGTLMYTNLRKTGMYYSAVDSTGKNLDFTQNQLYTKLTASIFPGWEISGFNHFAFYTEIVPAPRRFGINTTVTQKTEYAAGLGVSKSYWKIRTGINFSVSNFENSNQVRGEAYLTYLPKGNLNLYFTTGGMFQNDDSWGNTFQVNEEAGLKLLRSVWLETGLVAGNSFHYIRNQGLIMNNSFMIPSTSVYCNLIIMPWKKVTLNITPSYSRNKNYSWNLSSLYRDYELDPNSFGVTIKLIYNNY